MIDRALFVRLFLRFARAFPDAPEAADSNLLRPRDRALQERLLE
jgi:hypothetical protein